MRELAFHDALIHTPSRSEAPWSSGEGNEETGWSRPHLNAPPSSIPGTDKDTPMDMTNREKQWQGRRAQPWLIRLTHCDCRHAVLMLAYCLRVRRATPGNDLYNGLQRLAYSTILLIAVVEVLSGLAISKPVQLWWLGQLFGGYDGARVVHLLGLGLLALLTVVHLVMVTLHPRAILTMLTGGKHA